MVLWEPAPSTLLQVASAFNPNEEVTADRPKEMIASAEAIRHENYLKRAASGSALARPQKKHRKSAAHYMKMLDNQVPSVVTWVD